MLEHNVYICLSLLSAYFPLLSSRPHGYKVCRHLSGLTQRPQQPLVGQRKGKGDCITTPSTPLLLHTRTNFQFFYLLFFFSLMPTIIYIYYTYSCRYLGWFVLHLPSLLYYYTCIIIIIGSTRPPIIGWSSHLPPFVVWCWGGPLSPRSLSSSILLYYILLLYIIV